MADRDSDRRFRQAIPRDESVRGPLGESLDGADNPELEDDADGEEDLEDLAAEDEL